MAGNHQKKIIMSVLAACMALSMCSCQSKEKGELHQDSMESEIIQKEEISEQVKKEQEESEQVQEEQKDPEQEEKEEAATGEEDGAFSFADLNQIQFVFSSGAGGWGTVMTIDADGSFSGEYHDSDMGGTGDGYPNGTLYQCDFSGQFTQPVKVNDYTYSMQISELNFAKEVGTEEIRDDLLYVYSDAYGLDGAQDILIYLPGAPLEELPEEFRSWIGYYDLSSATDTKLPFYALNNEAQQYGFSGYSIDD